MRIVLIAALACLTLLSCGAASRARTTAPPPTVVASILPVHSLVAGVMEGVGKPSLLVPGGGSPHSFALRPSDARRLRDAQAVFWVGPSLETFLERPLHALARRAEIVALAEAEGVRRLPTREGGAWEAHGHEEDAHENAPGHDEWNPHVWLDPLNAVAFVDAIARALGHVDTANKARYDSNAARLKAKLRALDGELRQTLARAQGKAYIVFHDAYQYFEARYGLNAVGSITVSPELSPGARRLVEIRERIRDAGAVCVFSEPQFEPKIVRSVIHGTGARTGTLDPLGAQLTPGQDAYFQLMRNLAGDLVACLEKRS